MKKFALNLALLCTLLVVGSAGEIAAQSTANLFYIARTKNANKVYYEAKLNADGTFDQKEPVHAYWIMWAEDSTGKTREELSGLERRMAYGYTVSDITPTSFKMTLAAFKKRDIDVHFCKKTPCAEIVISGRPSTLQRLFVVSSEGVLLPHVSEVTLFGKDLKTGKETEETIKP